MRLDFNEEPRQTDILRKHKIFHRMINIALVGFGIGVCELAAGNDIAAGVAMGVGIIASAGAGVMASRQEVRQNNITNDALNQ